MSAFTKKAISALFCLSSLLSVSLTSAEPITLKISHQFPGGKIDEGDFRDQLVRKFAAEVEKQTKGELKFNIYPDSSLMKTNAQLPALRKGALDMSLVPIAYSGGEIPELNIGLMPGLVTSYEQGYNWKNAEVGKEFTKFMNEKGIILVTWIWQAGGVASRGKPIINPEDTKGLKIRGGSREMDIILKAAGSAVVSMPSNEIYTSMQSGALDAAMTSSTSLISFRLEEIAKSLTTGRDKAYWFMFEPLIMSKIVFEKLTKEQQEIILSVGARLEKFAIEACKKDDQLVGEVYRKKGATVVDLTEANVKKWQDIGRETAWKDYAAKTPMSAKLLELAEKVK